MDGKKEHCFVRCMYGVFICSVRAQLSNGLWIDWAKSKSVGLPALCFMQHSSCCIMSQVSRLVHWC